MSVTTTVQDWMRAIGSRERSAVTTRRHVAAETSTDVDTICATISHDVFFGVPVRTRAGNEIPDGSVLTTYDQVRGYYEGRAGSYVVLASAQLKSLTTDWYVFTETAATLRGTGEVNGVDATGREWVVNSAVIFPTATDGIRGEICVTRHPMDDIVAGTVRATAATRDGALAHLPAREMEHCALLDHLIEALRDSDWAGAGKLLSDRYTAAVRLDRPDGTPTVATATDRAGGEESLVALFDGVEDLTLLTRVASEWYAFAEYLVALDGGGVRRLALTHPIDDGRITGTFGYGRDER